MKPECQDKVKSLNSDLVAEVRMLNVNVSHMAKQMDSFVAMQVKMNDMLHHLDKNAVLRSEHEETSKKIHARIDKTNEAMREGFRQTDDKIDSLRDKWWKVVVYLAAGGSLTLGGVNLLQ